MQEGLMAFWGSIPLELKSIAGGTFWFLPPCFSGENDGLWIPCFAFQNYEMEPQPK
jgi:hypothetical protein